MPRQLKKKSFVKIKKMIDVNHAEMEAQTEEYMKNANKKLKKGFAYKENSYENPIAILIRFEKADHEEAIKIMNREQITFTKLVNEGLRNIIILKNQELRLKK